MKTPFKLKYKNSAFPFKESPMKQKPDHLLDNISLPWFGGGTTTHTYTAPKEVDPKIEEKKKQLDLEKEMKELYRKYEGLRRMSLNIGTSIVTKGIKTVSSIWNIFK